MDWIKKTLQPNGTLKNKLNIKSAKALQELEFRLTQYKYRSIPEYRIMRIDDLKKIHCWLFSDLYVWSGEYRTGDFHKDGTDFFPISRFDFAIENLNRQIEHVNKANYRSDLALAIDLGKLLLDINMFHPFREGNGRTQRLFVTLLAKQKGKMVHLRKGDPAYNNYMTASINDDNQLMAKVVLNAFGSNQKD
ncbi:MAG: Fic/DOC family protein [Sporolactobacillus sp.]